MTKSPVTTGVGSRSWLIWGFDFGTGGATALDEQDASETARAGFRWLHINLADARAFNWLDRSTTIADPARDLLRSTDRHARTLIIDGTIAGMMPDFERDFESSAVVRGGVLAFILTADLMITARIHPVCAADVIARRIELGACPTDAPAALELLISSIAQVGSGVAEDLSASVQASEDALLNEGHTPNARALVTVRRRAVQLHRNLHGIRSALSRLETDEDLPETLQPSIEKLIQRIAALDGDVMVLHSNLRELRDELEVQTANRVNQNLYVLSTLSALLLPATLVTGFFGMNTGGLLWAQDESGTVKAALLVAGSALAVYLWLRKQGFFRT